MSVESPLGTKSAEDARMALSALARNHFLSYRSAAAEDRYHPPRMAQRRQRAGQVIDRAVAEQNTFAEFKQRKALDSTAAYPDPTSSASNAAVAGGAAAAAATPQQQPRSLLDALLLPVDDAFGEDALLEGVADRHDDAHDDADAETSALYGLSDSDGDDDDHGTLRGDVGMDAATEAGDALAVATYLAVAGTSAPSAPVLSSAAQLALAAARRDAAKKAAAERRNGGAEAPRAANDFGPKEPAAMTYDEFMAANTVRVPRRGETAKDMKDLDVSELEAEGYVMSGSRNTAALKRMEVAQKLLHQKQAEKRRLDLVAEEHRRRNNDQLEQFRKLMTQPPPPQP